MKKIIYSFILMLFTINISQSQTTQEFIPFGLTSSEIDPSNATLSWRSHQSADFWQLLYQAALADEPTQLILSDTVAYLSNLMPNTRYAWKIRMIDVDGDTSMWSSENYFYTLSDDTLCPQVADMYLGTITNNSVNIQWQPAEGTNTWQVVCGELGTNPDNSDQIIQTQNYEYTFNQEFIEGNQYQFALRTNCQGAFSPWKYLYAKYLNENSVFQLPIQIDFEDTLENKYVGTISSTENPWRISSAINGSNFGSRALHVSNGNNYACNNEVLSVSYAYIDFYIPEYAESFYVDFSYHTQTQLENAGLKLYLIAPGSSVSINSLPSMQDQIGQNVYRGGNNQWIREHIELPLHHIGTTRRLLFVWYNSNQAPTSHAVAIDDIYLTARYCATPDNLEANYITSSSAILTWDFAETQSAFNLQFRREQDTTWTLLNAITPNYLLENLQHSTEYVYRVQADCGEEQSLWSDTIKFTTNTLIPSPENLTINNYSYNSAHLSWDNNLYAESYEVEAVLTTNNTSTIYQTTLNNIELTQLLPNSIYQISVKAISQTQDTSLSTQIFLHTLCSPQTEYPYYVEDTISFSTQSSFCNISDCWRIYADTLFSPIFDINTLYNPYLTFEYYSLQGVISKLFVSVDAEPWQEMNFNFVNGQNQISLMGFLGNNGVRFAIHSAMDTLPERVYEIRNFSIKDTCLSPENITINHITDNSAQIEWQTIGNITQHSLEIINTQEADTLTFSEVSSPFVVSDLSPMQEYKVILYSTCQNQQALNSLEEYFTTISTSQTCLTPENFVCQHYQVKGDETIICTWDAVEDNPYIQWEIQYKERLAVNYESDVVSIYPRFTLRNLDMGQQFDFRVRAICSVGDTSSWTEVVQVTVGEQSLSPNQYSGKLVKIYPNPSDSVIFIDTDAIELKNAQLVDAYGRVIRAWDILPREIDVSTVEAGNYILNFTMDNQPVSRKITIQ
ncbi:MAG: fibronectin type III domain-containing protein [Bacteroidales bacterium]|nr:fibronectin type III domain-containing protein [Bacteroidales bacterium]